jgi:hypothetical protein
MHKEAAALGIISKMKYNDAQPARLVSSLGGQPLASVALHRQAALFLLVGYIVPRKRVDCQVGFGLLVALSSSNISSPTWLVPRNS